MENLNLSNPLFNRDLSWLSFNERVLNEAENQNLPILERIKFLSIYSSNLDEFYRVRMPVILALAKLSKKEKLPVNAQNALVEEISAKILSQQQQFGKCLRESIIPELEKDQVYFFYGTSIFEDLVEEISSYYFSQVLAFLQPVYLDTPELDFFPNNNELYFLIKLEQHEKERSVILNIPSNSLGRFFSVQANGNTYVLFIDDIVRYHLSTLFPNSDVKDCFSFKITRTADLDLKDEFEGDLALQIEKQLQKRDFGLATRLLYESGADSLLLSSLIQSFNLQKATKIEGGPYHHLRDLADFPVRLPQLENVPWSKINYPQLKEGLSLFDQILKKDILVNPPYHSYQSILRFFNEAATDSRVTEIYVTLYRVASDSKIVNALISAAKNGKKVFVLVELKARFDEANNLKWAKKMKEAGVDIVYSVAALKVHAKIALVKKNINQRSVYTGLLATGNFNEITAKFYTDHILMTANRDLLREMELLFIFLSKRVKPNSEIEIPFQSLLVAQFNLLDKFISLIDREINHAKNGKSASITIKLNNLEEEVLINKLYEASQAGVKIEILVRGICCLIPQREGVSENIKAIRIVDRYLEHGRVFIFHNSGDEELYMGSADWMNRNIYRRIEVCFPILDPDIKAEIKSFLKLQLKDNVKAVEINDNLINISPVTKDYSFQSQFEIYKYLQTKTNENK